MRHENTTEEIREQAAFYALGLLSTEEARQFEAHLLEGCPCCQAEVDSFQAVVGHVAGLCSSAPPDGLRDRLLSCIKAEHPPSRSEPDVQAWKQRDVAQPLPNLFTRRSDEGDWEKTEIEGLLIRRLFVDPLRQTVTMLVKMDAGLSYPRHRHAGVEECYVLEGDLRLGPDCVLHAGDYQRAEAASIHDVQSTDGGCTLLVISSQHDEILA